MSKIGILGAGTWGMALARMLSNSGHEVTVWSALPEEVDALSSTRAHPNLPGMVIPEGILFTKSLETVCTGRDLLLFVVPSVFVRRTAHDAAAFMKDGQLVADAAKGIEGDTLFTMSEIMADEFGKAGLHGIRLVVLSGPTHAEEVAKDMPTTIVSASASLKDAEEVQDIFMNTCMRVYTNTDVKGVELCGALKNVFALLSGISAGLGYGDNARAGLITRGLAEMIRLGQAMGCRMETFFGLAGVGDLIVTATSTHSRNNQAGYLMGRGYTPEEAVKKVGMVVEGVNALPAAIRLRDLYGVEMPIVTALQAYFEGRITASDIVTSLMGRDRTTEMIGQSAADLMSRTLPERMEDTLQP
ncbi:MAG: NAD(P)-dependent glycerol-3-phosphate dehydrogenase [Lachnospiraceae bacterium]|nr:NAD(P)-dependent glycerol-3-phosphate dehydrogenase [Lachnospiraceae bacterium]